MKHPLRLCLLAAVLGAAAAPAVLGQNARVFQRSRPSHVPIEGGISPGEADRFLRDRLVQAEDLAQVQRLLTELAQHPERHGIERPRDQETLKRALKQAEGLPEKALKDPEVRRIITEAVEEQRNKPEVTPEERQERRRWEELADRFLPRESRPPDFGWHTGDNPNDPSQPLPGDPKPASGGPADPGRPPEAGPALTPAAPPPGPAPPPASSPVNDHLRDLAESLANSRLGESPAFRRLVANIDRVKTPEAEAADWNQRLDKLESRFASIGTHLPKIHWPRGERGPHSPVAPISPAASDSGTALGDGWQIILAAAVAGLLAWAFLRRKGLLVLRRADGGWRLGPWPVRPEAVHTREELVRAFEYLALLLLGPTWRSCHHREIAIGLGADDDTRRAAADRLADLYEQARYAPPDEELPASELAAARAHLSLLAGVASA